MDDEEMYNMEDMSGYEKSGIQHAGLSLEDLVLVLLPTTSGLVLAISRMVN